MSVLDSFLEGRPMEAPVVDIHLHLPPRDLFYRMSGVSRWNIPGLGDWEQHETFQNIASIVRHMDRIGTNKAIAFVNGFERLEEGYECVRRYPGRFLPTVSFWPGMVGVGEGFTTTPAGRRVPDSPAELHAVLEKVFSSGWRGIKLWEPRSPEPLTWLYEGVLGFAHEHRMIIVHHSWGPPDILDRMAQKFPNVRMLMGHALGSQRSFDTYAPVLRRRPNVFASTTNTRHPGFIEAMVRAFGDDQLVMGSDYILHTPEFSIGNLAYARIPDQSKRKILGLNMKSMLDELGYWDTWGFPSSR